MRSGVVITWGPKSKKDETLVASVEYFERYQDARDASAKLRESNVRHELWSKDGGLQRRIHGGKSCVNFDAAKHIPSESQKLTWAKQAEQKAAEQEQSAIAEASKPKEPSVAKTDPDGVKETDLEETNE